MINRSVDEGVPLSEAARATGMFPRRFVHLIAMGESGGDMPVVLEEVATICDEKCDQIVQWVSVVAVPVSIVAMGVIVAATGLQFFGIIRTLMNASGAPL